MSSRAESAVDHRNADPVQAARDLVRVLVEFAAGMELGHDDLGRRNPLLLVDADRNAAAIVGDGARAVGVQGHGDGVAIAGKRLVDRVVNDLIDHVVQAGAVIGVADIHAGPLAHCVEPAQHLDRVLVVGRVMAIRRAIAGAERISARTVLAEVARLNADLTPVGFAMSLLFKSSPVKGGSRTTFRRAPTEIALGRAAARTTRHRCR